MESKLLSFSIKSQLIKQGVVTTRHLIDNINKTNYLVEILNTGRRSDLLKQYKKEIYNKILSTKEGIEYLLDNIKKTVLTNEYYGLISITIIDNYPELIDKFINFIPSNKINTIAAGQKYKDILSSHALLSIL